MVATLGIKPFGHDTSAAIVIDGLVVAAISEERFNREKHSRKFPEKSIEFCLKQGKIKNINDLDEISICFDYYKLIYHLDVLKFFKYFPIYSNWAITDGIYQIKKILNTSKMLRSMGYRGKIIFQDHHDCHAASTYFTSGFNEASVLTIDGRGENAATCIYKAHGTQLKRVFQANYPNSLGAFYSCITEYLGFKENEDEGKIMGLAPYGDLSLICEMREVLKISDGDYLLDLTYFDFHKKPLRNVSQKFINTFGEPRKRGDDLNQHHKNIARAAQAVLEEALIALAEKTKYLTNSDKICLSGGVALNSVGNGKIANEKIFDDIFIYPAAGDDGASVGSALLSYYNRSNYQVIDDINKSAYLGPDTFNKQVLKSLKKYNLSFELSKNISKDTANLLSENKFVGWYQGRAEFGPRALGNRSILVNPLHKENKDLVNARIKFREPFRPFAPSVPQNFASNYFHLNSVKESPYMILAFDTKKDMRSRIPAVVHVDGSARVQTVTRKNNYLYWELLNEFGKITGTPVLLNTSFNIMGEPIVNTPEEAIRCYLGCGLDVLAIGDYLVTK